MEEISNASAFEKTTPYRFSFFPRDISGPEPPICRFSTRSGRAGPGKLNAARMTAPFHLYKFMLKPLSETVSPHTKLGHYSVSFKLGEGGIGEVYIRSRN